LTWWIKEFIDHWIQCSKRREKEEAMDDRLGPYLLGPNDKNQGIYTGDAKELAKAIPDESVDLIFTDPSWSRNDLGLFAWLSIEAKRVLKNDGFILTFSGKSHLDNVMMLLSKNLFFYWPIVGYQPQSNLVFNPRRILEKWRPALLYSKTFESKRQSFIPDLWPTNRDKRYHRWGQGKDFWLFYLSKFRNGINTLVLDPFTGGGTIPAVCKILSCCWLAFEIDPATAETARQRVAQTQPPLFTLEAEQTRMVI